MSKIRDENWYGVDLIAENEPETADKERNALLSNLIKAFKIEKIRISDSFLSFNLAKNEFVQEQNKGRYYCMNIFAYFYIIFGLLYNFLLL